MTASHLTPKSIVACANTLGEGVIWNYLRKVVIWFDISERKLMTFDPITQNHQTYTLPVMASAAMLTSHKDLLLISTERGIERFDFRTEQLVFIKKVEQNSPHNRSNDGKGAYDGSFWVSTMNKTDISIASGGFYRVRLPDRFLITSKNSNIHNLPAKQSDNLLDIDFLKEHLIVESMQRDIRIPNSLCFDQENLFFTDSPHKKLFRITHYHDLAPSQNTSPTHQLLKHRAQLFSDRSTEKSTPDGSTLDNTGNLWNAAWGTGEVNSYAHNGTVIETYKLPVSQVSCVAFGGADLKTLYITTARENLNQAQLSNEPLAGHLFALPLTTTPYQGALEPIFGQNYIL
ncbi:hypothetical protein COTS27_00506 [Spirochaetota bacterium]|nr:hypothetical protein COTS27_00506 [Spirochaetota bacterium]